MLEMMLKLYIMAMANDVRSPTPHVVGPPGCGKSTTAQMLADLLGVNLHIINVSRLSPLDVEGLQMPVDDNTRVHMIPAAFWSRLKEGDIVLFDEFLRGFQEVYNALLDIFTSRRAGAFVLPKVFIMAASNSITTYDAALEDRLMHLPVPDPRKRKGVKKDIAKRIVEQLGLLPEMVESMEMDTLLEREVLPMFEMLDNLKGKGSSPASSMKGTSERNLIGQAQLRNIESAPLKELIRGNNTKAMRQGKPQYVFITGAKDLKEVTGYESKARPLVGHPSLTEIQARNLDLNLQLAEMEKVRYEKEGTTDDLSVDDDVFV